ncbi:hypothetical protein K466DRAFT_662629 [Polyporus arcularius HHB13444]|uniref:Uncharacterized protein n=1 Tax=Polyporus arcularius HHB13444 TaxID=1314778 RepID=A0A5C3PI50_9APHY|nr:hypothetical protein K466DRAFT_662629 [Polyporus arcularius HHB13444]
MPDYENTTMPLSMETFRGLVEHLRSHVPIEGFSPSNMLLNLLILRITSVLGKEERIVLIL